MLIVGCAHCPRIFQRIDTSDTYDNDLLLRQIKATREAHGTAIPHRAFSPCRRPIFSG